VPTAHTSDAELPQTPRKLASVSGPRRPTKPIRYNGARSASHSRRSPPPPPIHQRGRYPDAPQWNGLERDRDRRPGRPSRKWSIPPLQRVGVTATDRATRQMPRYQTLVSEGLVVPSSRPTNWCRYKWRIVKDPPTPNVRRELPHMARDYSRSARNARPGRPL